MTRYYPFCGPRDIPSEVGRYIEQTFSKLSKGWRQEVGRKHDCVFVYPLARYRKGQMVGLDDPWDGEITFTAFPLGYMGGGWDGSISLHWGEQYKATKTHGEHGGGVGLIHHVNRVERSRDSVTVMGTDHLGRPESETFRLTDVRPLIQSTMDRWFA